MSDALHSTVLTRGAVQITVTWDGSIARLTTLVLMSFGVQVTERFRQQVLADTDRALEDAYAWLEQFKDATWLT